MRGTSFKEDIERVSEAFKGLLPNPFARHDSKRNKLRWFLHSLMNVFTEAVRRHPQAAAKIIVFGFPAMFILFKWGNQIVPQ